MSTFSIQLHESKPLTWWHRRQSKIDMNPSYQRKGRLWSTADKTYLIDSIINGFDVPKIYMADFTWGTSQLNKKNRQYAIIDGKQRFEAIFDFFEDRVSLSKDFRYLPDPKRNVAGLKYSELRREHADVAEEFETFTLTVMRVMAENEDPIQQLFLRLNRSKPLSGAEIRNAMSGPVPRVIRKIANHTFFEDYVKFGISRGQDKNTVAKLLLFEYDGDVNETKKKQLDDFVRDAKTQKDKLELAARRVMDNLDVMAAVFLPSDPVLTAAGAIPAYYWVIKSLDERQLSIFRDFLVDFEGRRKANRRLVSQSPKSRKIDPILSSYDEFNRSVNDLSSYRGRIDVLTKELRKFSRK